MRFVVIARAAALVACGALLSACPKKDPDVGPEPAAASTAQPAATSDKAGADAPAAPPKKKDDQGGW
jgi:hypothetical protein